MKKRIRNLFRNINERGNVLGISVMIMFVLASSLATITTIVVQQNKQTTIKSENTTDENIGKRLIQQAIFEFESYLGSDAYISLDDYEINMIPDVETNYNVRVSKVDEEIGVTEAGVSYTAYEYRFEYTLNNGKILQMSSFLSSVGSSVLHNGEAITPFDFSIGTNGDLVLSGGYYDNPTPDGDNPSFFAKSVYFNSQAPYVKESSSKWGTDYWTITPSSSSSYPDFPDATGPDDVIDMDIYFYDDYVYCGSNCWDYNGLDDPIILEKSKFVTVDGAGLETGNYEQEEVVPNFFGDFTFQSKTFDFIKNEGPSEPITGHPVSDFVFQGDLTIDNYLEVIMANTADPIWYCPEVWQNGYWSGRGRNRTWVDGYYYTDCDQGYNTAPDAPYTNLTSYSDELRYYDWSFLVSGVFEGDLIVEDGLHVEDRDNETLIITGDLIINNDSWITMDGKFVVLGDLIFQGDIVDIDGAFFVFGQTIFDFDDEAGIIENGGTDEYGVTIISQDNILFKSMWKYYNGEDDWYYERYYGFDGYGQFDAFLYTEESLYIESVNSRIQMRGVFFANAMNVSGNHIPVVDENGEYINGIVINSYRGESYSNNQYPSTDIEDNRFYYLGVFDDDYQAAFVEIPVFESIVFKEDGNYSTERSEFSYLVVETE